LIDRFDANSRSGTEQAGVGVAWARRDRHLFVFRVLPETPAARSGKVHKDDRLIAVGQGNQVPINVKGMPIGKVVSMIRGAKGTVVTLTIVPVGKTDADVIVVPLTRGSIKELNRFGDGRYLPLGSNVPDFDAVSLTNGEKYESKKARGKIVVLEFWFTGCAPCLKAIDQLQKLREEHPEWKNRVQLIAVVGVDGDRENATRCVQERGQRWTEINAVWTGPEILKSFHIAALPTVYVLDERGRVLAADHAVDVSRVIKKALSR
jgi:thiol-disulfide isomerase/thioredoxin